MKAFSALAFFFPGTEDRSGNLPSKTRRQLTETVAAISQLGAKEPVLARHLSLIDSQKSRQLSTRPSIGLVTGCWVSNRPTSWVSMSTLA